MNDNSNFFRDLEALVTPLAAAGAARNADVTAGGEAWALYRDWCADRGVPSDVANLAEWYATSKRRLSPLEYGRLAALAEKRG